MIDFVKPYLLGTMEEYTNRFMAPIMNGQYHDSTDRDIKIMKKRTHVLCKLLKKTIHVCKKHNSFVNLTVKCAIKL